MPVCNSSAVDLSVDNYRFLQQHVLAEAGIVIESDKQYLFDSRLTPISRQLGLGNLNDLCALYRATRQPQLGRQIAEAMTTNETYFFRDPGHYDAIRQHLLPRLCEQKRDQRRLRFWSAAASTGQEAYSLAMLLVEAGLSDWNLQILGTDFSLPVLERARAGRYQQIEMNRGLPAALLVKYFRRAGMEWQLNDTVRALVRFETIDLRASMRTLGPFDLVFCRNVLIYFDGPTRQNILRQIHSTLFRGGWLLVGGAEMVTGLEDVFERLVFGNATVYVAR